MMHDEDNDYGVETTNTEGVYTERTPHRAGPAPATYVHVGDHHYADSLVKAKSVGVAYLLLLTLGLLGVHQFYLGKAGRGVGYLLTGAWFGVGALVDLFTLPAQTRTTNAVRSYQAARRLHDRVHPA